MTEYVNKVKRSKSLWEGSKSRLLLKETFIGAAAISVPITRIMCFGLGELQLNGKLPHSVFQHMAVYDIAKALRRYYERPGQESEKIEILFQDPNYKPRDEKVLRQLHYHMGCTETSTIKFVNDPDGLAITRNTRVVTAFVPNQYRFSRSSPIFMREALVLRRSSVTGYMSTPNRSCIQSTTVHRQPSPG
jgi:hypothetical protein